MAAIKSFFLCIVMLSFVSSYAMENTSTKEKFVNVHVINVWNKIDRDHVGVSDCVMNVQWHLRSLVGSCLSMYKGYRITPQQAAKEWDKIQSYIPPYIKKESVLEELVERHWYVNYVMQALADQKARELEDITGSNVINKLHDLKKVDSVVFSYACNKFLNKSLLGMMPENISDIHFIALEHPDGNVNPASLAMSADDKYLRATSNNGTYAVWEMETATLVDRSNAEENRAWWKKSDLYADYSHKKQNLFGGYSSVFMERYRVTSNGDQYCAMATNAYMSIDSEFLPVEIARNPKAILLFKKPEAISYFCQKAFDNSYTKSAELSHLRNSTVVKSIQGFPRQNLERVIDNRIKTLTNK